MRLSAIIPTHNRPETLGRCLATLALQEVDPGQFEVVVVDDGSELDVEALVADAAAGTPVPMRCERQELTGLNSARNRGASVAGGDVLGFLDDDTLVSRGWARSMIDAFDRHPCAGVGGRVELGLAAPAPPWLAQRRYYLAEYDLGPESHWLADEPVPVGANCAVRRSEFDRVGRFQPGLDRIGGSLVSNGDTEFFRRLGAAGGRLRYEPAAHVIHCVPPERLTIEYFDRRHYAQGVSDELMFRLEGGATTWGYRVFLARQLAHVGTTLCTDLARGRGTLNTRFSSRYWAGRLSALRTAPAAARSIAPRSARR